MKWVWGSDRLTVNFLLMYIWYHYCAVSYDCTQKLNWNEIQCTSKKPLKEKLSGCKIKNCPHSFPLRKESGNISNIGLPLPLFHLHNRPAIFLEHLYILFLSCALCSFDPLTSLSDVLWCKSAFNVMRRESNYPYLFSSEGAESMDQVIFCSINRWSHVF